MFWLLLGGFITLMVGAEVLLRGAVRLAMAFGVSSLTIGLTVVAFGTSAPELAVSVQAALNGQSGLALGNVVGSNIFNVLFILGLSAAIVPLTVSRQLIRIDVPIMVGVSGVVLAMALDGQVSHFEGGLLVCGLLTYTVWTVWQAKRSGGDEKPEIAQTHSIWRMLLYLGLVGMGLVLLVLGARWLVSGAVGVAQLWGVSDQVIGLTIVAVGTSLPEVATSIMASLKGERDIAVGNVVGSNLFNLLGVLGVTSAIAPVQVVPQMLWTDMPIMLAVAVACLPVFFTGRVIARWEGVLFLGYYVFYTAFLILSATGASVTMLQIVMLAVVLPLTVLTLGITVWRQNPAE